MSSDMSNAAVSTAEKVRHLSRPSFYPHGPESVAVIETHMSYVFLAGDFVYKLKKPVRFAFLDFSTLDARERDCLEELRLNRRLAPGVYLSVVPLTLDPSCALRLRGEGEIVDWLVEMRRLPEAKMLDRLLRERSLDDAEIDRLSNALARFYRCAERTGLSPSEYVDRFLREHAENRSVLMRRDFALDHDRVPLLLDRLELGLRSFSPLLEERVRSHHVVDGHGDLRPEHICLGDPLVIFDCLEFNHELRQVDPFDELAFLDIECVLLGAPETGPRLIARMMEKMGDAPPAALVALYAACRAVLRARLAVAHLLDSSPRDSAKWEPLAARYLRLAEKRMAEF
jgi:aminoglycoside phosphotransferase family enzyme